MKPFELSPGEIVQIDPKIECFGGCLMVVTDPKSWGAIGYVKSAGIEGLHWYAANFECMEPVGGTAPWRAYEPGDHGDENCNTEAKGGGYA